MTPINALDLITDDVIDKSAATATELLKQSGWDIVNEMAKAAADLINSTALVVLPVSVNMEEYKSKLTDPEGFENKFNTLRNDVLKATKVLSALHAEHEGRSGAPEEADMDLIQALTLGYSKLQTYIESAIQPLILNLVEQLETAGITELTVEGK